MDVAIVGIGIHPFGRTPSRSGLQQGAFAARLALQDGRYVHFHKVQGTTCSSLEYQNNKVHPLQKVGSEN